MTRVRTEFVQALVIIRNSRLVAGQGLLVSENKTELLCHGAGGVSQCFQAAALGLNALSDTQHLTSTQR